MGHVQVQLGRAGPRLKGGGPARRLNAFMTLLTAFQGLLARYRRRRHCGGHAHSGAPAYRVEGLVGFSPIPRSAVRPVRQPCVRERSGACATMRSPPTPIGPAVREAVEERPLYATRAANRVRWVFALQKQPCGDASSRRPAREPRRAAEKALSKSDISLAVRESA